MCTSAVSGAARATARAHARLIVRRVGVAVSGVDILLLLHLCGSLVAAHVLVAGRHGCCSVPRVPSEELKLSCGCPLFYGKLIFTFQMESVPTVAID